MKKITITIITALAIINSSAQSIPERLIKFEKKEQIRIAEIQNKKDSLKEVNLLELKMLTFNMANIKVNEILELLQEKNKKRMKNARNLREFKRLLDSNQIKESEYIKVRNVQLKLEYEVKQLKIMIQKTQQSIIRQIS